MHLLLRESANVGAGQSETHRPVSLSAKPLGHSFTHKLVSLKAKYPGKQDSKHLPETGSPYNPSVHKLVHSRRPGVGSAKVSIAQ